MKQEKVCISLMSGGIDSYTSAKLAQEAGYEIIGLFFDYNQRTKNKEYEMAKKQANILGIKVLERIPIQLAEIGSALTNRNQEIPKDKITEEGNELPVTFVPARNIIFLSYAFHYARVFQAEIVSIGVNQLDFSGYPDCTDRFIELFQKAVNYGVYKSEDPITTIFAPLQYLDKKAIMEKAFELGLNVQDSWSCYEREDEECGHCESCLLKYKALEEMQ